MSTQCPNCGGDLDGAREECPHSPMPRTEAPQPVSTAYKLPTAEEREAWRRESAAPHQSAATNWRRRCDRLLDALDADHARIHELTMELDTLFNTAADACRETSEALAEVTRLTARGAWRARSPTTEEVTAHLTAYPEVRNGRGPVTGWWQTRRRVGDPCGLLPTYEGPYEYERIEAYACVGLALEWARKGRPHELTEPRRRDVGFEWRPLRDRESGDAVAWPVTP